MLVLVPLPSVLLNYFFRYIVSYLWLWLLYALGIPGSVIDQLRFLNLVQIITVYFTLRQLLYNIFMPSEGRGKAVSISSDVSDLKYLTFDHEALNLCLFPPLFFFSSLYYTDITSAALLLQTYVEFQAERTTRVVIGSLLALCMRQTNIFWTAIYFGSLEALRRLKRRDSGNDFPVGSSMERVLVVGWQHSRLYDPLVKEAGIKGM